MPAPNVENTAKQKRVQITVSKDSMNATMLLRNQGDDAEPITIDEIMNELTQAEIVFGINKNAIEDAVLHEKLNTPIIIAEGTLPQRGENSRFTYNFNTSQEHRPKVDDDGRIDYKNINFIQNVEKGQVLATCTPPEPGKPGTNIFGKSIKGPDGRAIPFKNGVNTAISNDGLSLVATASGAIVYLYGKIAVNDVMVISGDVDFNVGNINCRGSVKVTGHIKAGFELKIDGDLEVAGNVEDCQIDVKGNIMIKGGFFGKGEGYMHADGDVFLKYAEGQKIVAGGDINIGGEVINCQLLAGGNVCVKGNKGKIVGGTTKAYKEIKAAVLGSDAGTKTVLAVAYDSELMKKYANTVKEIERLNQDSEKIKKVMYNLYRQQMDGKLTPEKTEALNKLEQFQKSLPTNLENMEKDKIDIEETLKKLEDARIIAENMLYPGVRARFGLIYRDILEEQSKCVLKLDGNKVYISEYIPEK